MNKTIFILLLSGFSVYAQFDVTHSVTNLAQLKKLSVTGPYKIVEVRGKTNINDGWQGKFVYKSGSTMTADDGMAVQPDIGACCWERQVIGKDIFARWFDTSKTNNTINNAIRWVSTNGGGTVIVDGGTWISKSDDTNRIRMQSNVRLTTALDSQIVCAPSPATNWILIDFALDSTNMIVGPAKLIGWNLDAPGGNTNNTGVIFAAQDTKDLTVGGIISDNWYNKYFDIGSNNERLQILDENWLPTIGGLGVKADGRDDTKNIQEAVYYAERYHKTLQLESKTYKCSSIFNTNGVGINILGNKTVMEQFYYNPDEGVVPRYSSVFTVSANNTVIDGFTFNQVGAYPATETNSTTTGFFIPVNIHNATNWIIQNCTFNTGTGKGIIVGGGANGKILNNTFNYCGITFGNAHQPDWLFYEVAVPFKLGPSRSSLGMTVKGNTFNYGSPYKSCLFLSAVNDILVDDNHFNNMNCSVSSPLVWYTGDEGTTDYRGTNVYEIRGQITHTYIDGTDLGPNGGIYLKFDTTTNYVQTGFNPSNIISKIVIRECNVSGVGQGITILSAPGTVLKDNTVNVSSSPIWSVGNGNDLLIEGGTYACTNQGIGKITFPFSDGFGQPAQFKRVTFRNAQLTSATNDEVMFRNIEPLYMDSFTVDNCKINFNGLAGSGDYPQIFQLTISTNFIKYVNNKIYLTNGMSGRRIGIIISTNADTVFDGNKVFGPSDTFVRRGPYFKGNRVFASGNDVGSFEVQQGNFIVLKDNRFSSLTNTIIPLEIHDSGYASVIGNVGEMQHTNNGNAFSIGATNSAVYGNTVIGNSPSDMIRCIMGKMYESDNIILNPYPGAYLYPTASGSGSVAHSMHERSTVVTSPNNPIATWTRNVANTLNLSLDNWFTGSSRDAIWKAEPINTNDLGGHAFFAKKTNGVSEFGFGLQGGTPLVLFIGTPTNSVKVYLSSVPTNSLIYADDQGLLSQVTIGANMTFSSGTLNSIGCGGGAATNLTPWTSDIDGNGFYLTNAGGIKLKHSDGSTVSYIASNNVGEVRYELVGTGARIWVSALDDLEIWNNGASQLSLGLSGILPSNNDTLPLGSASLRFSTLNVSGSSGINLGGIKILSGSGSPEGVVAAPVGSFYFRTNGAAGTIMYGKELGVGTTGWQAYNSTGGGGGGSGTNIGFINLQVQSYKLTGTPARLSAAENSWKLLFGDTSDESGIWQFVMPPNFSSNLKCRLLYSMASATSGAVDMEVSVMATTPGDATDENIDSYDSTNVLVDAVPATAGYLKQMLFTLSSKDNAVAGDLVKIKINRDANNVSDTATGDLELLGICIEYTTP